MAKVVVSDHEYVKVDEHKSHLFMNVLAMDELCKKKMTSDECTEWNKAINYKDTVYGIELVEY